MERRTFSIALSILLVQFISAQSIDPSFCQAEFPASKYESIEGYSLRQVQLVHRHGDRSPGAPFTPLTGTQTWNCPQKLDGVADNYGQANVQTWSTTLFRQVLGPGNCSLGQLTAVGRKQGRLLGNYIKSVYVDSEKFLSSSFSPSDYLIFSSPTPRALHTGEAVFYALYPNASSLPPGTVQVATQDSEYAWTWHGPTSCPNYQSILAKVFQTDEFQVFNQTILEPMISKIAQDLGIPTEWIWGDGKNPFASEVVTDALQCSYCNRDNPDISFPSSISDDFAEYIFTTAQTMFRRFFFQQPSLFPIDAAPLMSAMVPYMNDIVNYTHHSSSSSSSSSASSTDPRFLQWSAHGETLMGLMFGLNCSSCQKSIYPYASHVLMELWEHDQTTSTRTPAASSQFVVRILFNGEPAMLPCSDQQGLCSWDDFQSLLYVAIPPNWPDLCGVSISTHRENISHKNKELMYHRPALTPPSSLFENNNFGRFIQRFS